MARKGLAEDTTRDIRRKTHRKYSAEEKLRIVMEGLRDEMTVAELCRRVGIAQSLYYKWSKEFLEAGKARLAGDTKRQATSHEVKVANLSRCLCFLPQCVPMQIHNLFRAQASIRLRTQDQIAYSFTAREETRYRL